MDGRLAENLVIAVLTCIKNLSAMKKVTLFLLPLAIASAGCSKDSDFPWDSYDNSSSSSQSGTKKTSGVTGATTIDVSYDEEDLISGTKFGRTITINFSDAAGASVSGDENGIVSIDGNNVTVDNTSTSEKVKYVLTGSTTNGFLKIYSNNKQALYLSGVSIRNPNGAAINNQGKKRCFVVLSGENTLKDGSSYTATPDDEDEKAAFFSEGQLIFSGDGSLSVVATGKAGITSDDYLHFIGENTVVTVTSAGGHAVRGKDYVMVSAGTLNASSSAAMKKGVSSDSLVVFNGGVTNITVSGGTAYDSDDNEYKAAAGVKADQLFIMNAGEVNITSTGAGGKGINGDGPAYFQGGTLTVNVKGSNYGSSNNNRPGGSSSSSDSSKSAKGIKFDGNIYVSGGDIVVTSASHEGFESKGVIEITGGNLYVKAYDDAINSKGNLAITGGNVMAWSTGNDGIDANGDCFIEGGVVYAIGKGSPEVAIDANTEGGYKLYVNGGTLFAIGGLESGSVLSQTCYSSNSWSKNTWYSLTAGNATYGFKSPSSGGTGLVVSAASKPTVKSGVSATADIWEGMGALSSSVSGGSEVTLSTYSGGGMGL